MFLSRDELIDVNIERAVSKMQAVIELGRVIRDRKTMPMKVSVASVNLGEVSVMTSREYCLEWSPRGLIVGSCDIFLCAIAITLGNIFCVLFQ